MSNMTHTSSMMEVSDRDIIRDESQSTVISDAAVDTSTITDVHQFQQALIEQNPGKAETIASMDASDYSSASEFLTALNDLITDTGGSEEDTIQLIPDTYTGDLYFDELKDLAIPATSYAQVTIQVNDADVLDNIYQPGFDGMIHLDLQELIREHSGIFLPTAIPGSDLFDDNGDLMQKHAHISLVITANFPLLTQATRYSFGVFAFDKDATKRMTDIDRMSIPEDYLMPLSLHLTAPMHANPITTAFLEDTAHRIQLNSGQPGESREDMGDIFLVARDIPVAAIPYRKDTPFRIVLSTSYNRPRQVGRPVVNGNQTLYSPVFTVVNGQFEQYLFLNKYGHYDNIAMSGALTFTPEYNIENAHRSYVIDRVKGVKNNLWTQNTGPLSKTTMNVLSELLLSPFIYRYVPGESLRRIVTESPTLTISNKQSINTATFSWRYAEK